MKKVWNRASDKMQTKITLIDTTCVISSLNPMIDHLLELSRRDDSDKWSSVGFGEEIGIIEIYLGNLSGALGRSLLLRFVQRWDMPGEIDFLLWHRSCFAAYIGEDIFGVLLIAPLAKL